jgi:hypothetical protein
MSVYYTVSVPMTAPSATHSLAGIVGSNPTVGDMDVCRECCVLSGRVLCDGLITRTEEVLQTVVRRCV